MEALYVQRTGKLYLGGDILQGHAGRGEGRDNPDMEHVRNVGPLPRGTYRVRLEPHPRFRYPALHLYPLKGNRWGRSGFWIHGGTVSHGCIILQKPERLMIAKAVTFLDVVPDLPPVAGT